MKIGVLALQGDFQAHGEMLKRLGVEPVFPRTASELEGLDGLILPGGESTTQLKFLDQEGLAPALREFAAHGGALFGTCAGAILLAREVRNPPQASLGLLDMAVSRNAYGRQVESDIRWGKTILRDQPFEMVFIRAPVIDEAGPGLQVLAEEGGHPVMVRQGRVMATTFHPELTGDDSIHRYFLGMTAERA